MQATLAHYLYRDQIRHLQNRSLWPAKFEERDGAAGSIGEEYGTAELRANTNHDFRDMPPSSDESDEGSNHEEELAVDALGNTIGAGGSSEEEDEDGER